MAFTAPLRSFPVTFAEPIAEILPSFFDNSTQRRQTFLDDRAFTPFRLFSFKFSFSRCWFCFLRLNETAELLLLPLQHEYHSSSMNLNYGIVVRFLWCIWELINSQRTHFVVDVVQRFFLLHDNVITNFLFRINLASFDVRHCGCVLSMFNALVVTKWDQFCVLKVVENVTLLLIK